MIAHTASYIVAGAIALKLSKDIYESKNRLCHFLMIWDLKKKGNTLKNIFYKQVLKAGSYLIGDVGNTVIVI